MKSPWAAIPVVLAVAVVAGCSGLGVETDHATVEQGPEPFGAEGPQRGAFEPTWSAELPAGAEGYHLVDGQLVVVVEDGLQAFDARTGEQTWHYREPGRSTWTLAASGGAVVLQTYLSGTDGESSTIEDEHLVGLDAGTGELLWENTDEWSITSQGYSSSSSSTVLGDSADGIVVTSPDGPFTRGGVDARTGEEKWRVDDHDVAEDCTPKVADDAGDAGAADDAAELVLIRISCGLPDDVYVALEAQTGELRWRRPVSGTGGGYTTMRDGYALIDAAERPPVIVGPDGEDLFVGEDGTRCTCELQVAGGQFVLKYENADSDDLLVTIDPADGTARPVEAWPETYGEPIEVAGGTLYAIGQTPYGLLPTMLTAVDVADVAGAAGGAASGAASGPVRTVPWLAELTGVYRPWQGFAGTTLLSVRQAIVGGDPADPAGPPVLEAYEVRTPGEPAELGGVSPGEWPEPCALLAGLPVDADDAADEPGQFPEVAPPGEPVQVGTVMLPRTSCGVRLGFDDGVGVSIVWTGATPEQAAALAAGRGRGLLPRSADEARLLADGSVLLRVGRALALVTVEGTLVNVERAAEIVGANLQAALGQ